MSPRISITPTLAITASFARRIDIYMFGVVVQKTSTATRPHAPAVRYVVGARFPA
ncbi:hypothetical protein P692DRAFT_20835696 [Suillus brevipes Sb2]|nr:hypothetical protein P692DRAFT_20835696 [Suillus brevipes Sb2]